jgi:hypothetical protein
MAGNIGSATYRKNIMDMPDGMRKIIAAAPTLVTGIHRSDRFLRGTL